MGDAPTRQVSTGTALRRALTGIASIVALALVAVACGTGSATTSASDDQAADGDEADGNGPAIVATTTILGDVVSQVAGDAAEVSVLMPVGADPHNFEPSAQQQAQLLEADLIVANGAGLEATLADPLAEAERSGVPVFTAIDHVEHLTGKHGNDADVHAGHADEDEEHPEGKEHPEEDEEHAEHDGAHDGEGVTDPHFWMDPLRMAGVARELGEQIAEAGGDGAQLRQQAAAYATQLEAVDGQIDELLAALPDDQRTLVTNHDAFSYFADRYDFRIVGTVIPGGSTGAEPSAQDLEELAQAIAQENVPAVFTESVAPGDLAETLAQEVDAEVAVVTLYSGSLDAAGTPAGTYLGMLRTNAQRISDALS